jgi:pyrroline-5-carboxylate reductase
MMLRNETRLAFIGAGHITSIILDSLVKAGTLPGYRVIASDPDREKLQRLRDKYQVSMAQDNVAALEAGDFIFINVRPQVVGQVIDEFCQKQIQRSKIIITLAAGIPIDAYDRLGDNLAVVRALPNPPSQVGMGIAALSFNPRVTENQKNAVFELFSCLGEYVVVDEDRINAIMALSSPAATCLFFDSLVEAGVNAGIDLETSTKVISQTIMGTMEVWKQRHASPNELLSEACTPGGISEQSVMTLEQRGFRNALLEAIDNAVLKAVELGDAVQKSS